MGAIVASLLTRMTSACRYKEFFSNEGREIEMLSSGCAVGIACTFSAPAGGNISTSLKAQMFAKISRFMLLLPRKF